MISVVTEKDLTKINEALKKGLDVNIHPGKYGVKITSAKVSVLRSADTPNYGFSDKRE